ncbi:MAG: DUF411 domain-containing protein [Sterolibacterium sp.]|jgi:hypothetical protein
MKLQIRLVVFLSLFAPGAWAAAPLPTVQVYKSPTCGCCGKWIGHLKASGFDVVTHDTNNVTDHKTRLGVPTTLESCHTAEVGGYVIEGHVPAGDVRRLLAERPRARGLVSPGMPPSAPGMDGKSPTPYDILLVKNDGTTNIYAHH